MSLEAARDPIVERERLLSQALGSLAAFFVTDADGGVEFVSESYRHHANLPSDDPAGGLRLPAAHLAGAREAMAAGTVIVRPELTAEAAGPRGEMVHFPLRDDDGLVVGVCSQLRDTTREIALSRQLRQERRRTHDIIRASTDWVWETDDAGRIRYVSDRITAAIGIPAQRLRGRPLGSLGRPAGADRDGEAAGGWVDLASMRPFRDVLIECDDPGDDPGGEPRQFSLSGVPVFDESGRYVGYRGTGSDVTEHRRAEDALKAAKDQLEVMLDELAAKNSQLDEALVESLAAARSKDLFLASVSHELRTPLNAVLGFAEIMEMGIYGELGERHLSYVQNIMQAGRHLMSLIEDLLDVARIDADALALDSEPVPLRPVVEQVRAMIQAEAAAKSVDISAVNLSEDVVLVGDERRCVQIITNLLSNAVKFTPPGGKVGVELAARRDGERARAALTVWDTGPGIPPALSERVFEPFNRGDAENLVQGKEGFGIGLAIARKLAKLMDGDIELTSQVGVGSRFTVYLPVAMFALAAT